MPWYVDAALNRLLAQINAAAPNRSKASDGSIGDAAHAAGHSDHNPESDGSVDARDFTHDPSHGADMFFYSEILRLRRDPRISYIIFHGRITGPNYGWEWNPYQGDNNHNKHLHVSVNDKDENNDAEWNLMLITQKEFNTLLENAIKSPDIAAQLAVLPWRQKVGRTNRSTHDFLFTKMNGDLDQLVARPPVAPAPVVLDETTAAALGKAVGDYLASRYELGFRAST